jgi:hypothetical protein
MKRKEHTPNWAVESFGLLLDSLELESDKRDQYYSRGITYGISVMISIIESLFNPFCSSLDVSFSECGGNFHREEPEEQCLLIHSTSSPNIPLKSMFINSFYFLP